MRRTPAALVAAPALCAMLLAAGCGTTVSPTEQAAAGVATDSLGGDPAATSSVPGVPGAGSTAPSSTSTGVSAGTTAPGAGVGTAGGAGTAAGGGAGSKAVTRGTGPIEIGFLVAKCGNCDLLGGGYNQTAHSMQDVLQALVNDQNSKGGILGRKIVPVFAEQDTAAPDFNTMLQAICATFTQDHKVAAVVGAGFGFSDILANCLGKARIPVIDAMRTTGVPDSVDLERFPGYVLTSEPMLDVYNLVAYTSGVADGWLKPTSTLGVLNFDCPASQRVWKNVIKPYLAANDIPVKVDYTAKCFKGASDIGRAAQEVQQSVLAMQANGVDVVAITDIPLVVFATSAESQAYYPKYLATEGGGPSYETLVSPGQVRNIHAPGWAPVFDVNSSQQPPLTPLQRSCLARLAKGGMSGATSSEHVLYFPLCGGFDLYLHAAATAGDLSWDAILGAVDSLAGSFTNPFLLEGRTRFGPKKHTAPVLYRSTQYVASCSCFQYVGPVRPLPLP